MKIDAQGLYYRDLNQKIRAAVADGADKIALTTPDRKFTIRTVACFGQCALAPVVEVDHAIFGHMNERALHRELEHLNKNGRKKA